MPYARHAIDAEDEAAVLEVLRSSHVTQGPKVPEFEQALCDYTGSKYAVAVSNGTAALHLACIAAGIRHGAGVLVPTLTFAASANAIVMAGGTPAFCDVSPKTWTIQESIPTVGVAIMPVYFAGLPVDIPALRRRHMAQKRPVIADAAHALGATFNGKRLGEMGADLTILSFHPAKHICTGEGGAVLTNSLELATFLRSMRDHGRGAVIDGEPWAREQHACGFNYRMQEMSAALGISQLRKAPRWLERRRRIARTYYSWLSTSEVQCQSWLSNPGHAWHLFPIWLDPARYDRKAIYFALKERGVMTQVHYRPLHTAEFYAGQKRPPMPNAERFYAGCLSLPMFGTMTDAEVDHVVTSVKAVLA